MSLSDNERQRIRLEELYRAEVRRELAVGERPKSRLLEFLNSNLGLWILSAVFVSGLSTVYQCYDKHRDEARLIVARDLDAEHQKKLTARKLDREISHRYSRLLGQLHEAAERWQLNAPNPGTDWKHLSEDYGNHLKNGKEEAIALLTNTAQARDNVREQSLYPDYANYTLPSLIAELGVNVDDTEQRALDEARKHLLNLKRGGDIVTTTTPPAEQLASLIIKRCVLPRWKNSVFQYTACAPTVPFCD